jgi:hypothetical protein
VLEGELDEQSPGDKSPTPIVVKASFIVERRLWRERFVIDALYAADPERIAGFTSLGLRVAGPGRAASAIRTA